MAKGYVKRKLTGSAEYNSPDFWKTSLKHSADLRKRYSSIDRWSDIEGYWNHDFPAGDPVFNLVYMFGRSLIPTLMFKNPTIINTPRFPQHIPFASMMDSMDEWLVQEMELEDIMKKAILYAYLYNMAPVETGFDFPIGAEGDTPEERFQSAFLANMGTINTTGVGKSNRARRQNFPWLDCIYPRKILFEPTTRDMRTCRWYAKSLYQPTRIMREDKMLNTDKVKATHMPPEMCDTDTKDILDSMSGFEEYTHFFEIHNSETQEMLIMQSDGQMLLDPTLDPMQFDGLPIDTLIFNQNPLSIWGTPDSLYIEPQMLEGNELRSLGIKQARASLLKFVINSENMDEEEIEKMFTDDVVALRAKNIPPNNQSLANVIMPMNTPPKLEFEMVQNSKITDAQKILGFGQNQSGYGTGRKTKGEADIIQYHNQLRTDERRYMVAQTITGIMRKVNQSVIKYWNEPMLLRVLGMEGTIHWVKAKPQDIKAEMNLKVDVESLSPPSKERTKDDILKLIQILANTPDANVQPLLRRLMSKFPDVDASEVFPTAPDEESPQQFAEGQQKMLNDPNARKGAMTSAERMANLG